MKGLLLFFCLIFLLNSNISFSQSLPNGDFEVWNIISFNQPDSGWNTSNPQSLSLNDSLTVWVVGGYINSAVHLQTKVVGTDTLIGYITNSIGNPFLGKGGIAYSQIPTYISGFYKSFLHGSDSATLVIIFKNSGSIISTNIFKIKDTISGSSYYDYFKYNLYVPSIPDSVIIAVTSSNINRVGVENGNWLEIDEIAFLGDGITQYIPNGSFDYWETNSFQMPAGWNSKISPFSTGVIKTNDSYTGFDAIELKTLNSVDSLNGLVPTKISTGKFHLNSEPTGGLPFSLSADRLKGYYKYIPSGNDTALIKVSLSKSGNIIDSFFMPLIAASVWTYFELPFGIVTLPDSILIEAMSSKYPYTTTIAGSQLLLDDLQLRSQALADHGKIFVHNSICVGYPNPFTESVSGGVWSLTNNNASLTGTFITGITAGNDTLVYTVTNAYGNSIALQAISIVTMPEHGIIFGPSNICLGSSITFLDSVNGGVWSSFDNSIATVSGIDSVIGAGVVTAIHTGGVVIDYSVSNFCGSVDTTIIITVDTSSIDTITGLSLLCIGTIDSLHNSLSGGIWSTTNNHAIVSSDGMVGGVTRGMDTIIYSVNNSCGLLIANKYVNIVSIPIIGEIIGNSNVCLGTVITLSDTTIGGIWSVSNGLCNIASGAVNGIGLGVDTVHYSVLNLCGVSFVSHIISIITLPDSGIISGSSFVCEGSSISLTETVLGGTWNIRNSDAIITTGGNVYGILQGLDTVLYTVSNTCGIKTAQHIITVNPLPNAGIILGPSDVCEGQSITLTHSAGIGIWSAKNASSTITTSGVVTGVFAGIDTIIYTVINTCGTDSTIQNITIHNLPNAGNILGDSTICLDATITLYDSVSGGYWSNLTGKIIVSSAGIVVGLHIGIDTVTYSVTNYCGTAVAKKQITVNSLPIAGFIVGLSDVCKDASITLADTASGGVWSMSNTNAAVSGGVVIGNNPGTDTLKYAITNICGTSIANKLIYIKTLPDAGIISGKDSVCIGESITLTDTVSGGFWSCLNPNVFVVSSLSNGIITGLADGMDTINYNVSNICGTSSKMLAITILSAFSPTITGKTFSCIGKPDTLIGLPSGGVWSASNTLATIINNVTGGLVTGNNEGLDTIYYTITNYCGVLGANLPIIIYTATQCDSINYVHPFTDLNENISLYPNPNSGVFKIKLPMNENYNINVTDLTGKIIYNKNIESLQNEIEITDMNHLPNGVYLIYIATPQMGNDVYRGKLIILN